MKDTIKQYYTELKNGTITMFKEFFNKKTNKKQRANMWTFSRLIISVPILILSFLHLLNFSMSLLITNSILVGVGAITDYFDGKSARKHGSTSEYGKKLDQVVDKVFSIVVGGTLAFVNPIYIIPLLGEAFIATINVPAAIKYKGINDNSSFIGKIKQWPLGAAFILGYLSPLTTGLNITAFTLILITLLLQLATAQSYIKRNDEYIKNLENDNKLIDIEESFEKTNNLEKTIGEKEINGNANVNTKLTNKELCDKLKELREELIHDKKTEDLTDEKGIQKTKK